MNVISGLTLCYSFGPYTWTAGVNTRTQSSCLLIKWTQSKILSESTRMSSNLLPLLRVSTAHACFQQQNLLYVQVVDAIKKHLKYTLIMA